MIDVPPDTASPRDGVPARPALPGNRLIVLAVVLALVMDGLIGWGLWRTRIEARRAFGAAMAAQNDVSASHLVNRLDAVDALLKSASASLYRGGKEKSAAGQGSVLAPASAPATATASASARAQWLQDHADTGRRTRGLYIADATGAIVGTSRGAALWPASVATQDFFLIQKAKPNVPATGAQAGGALADRNLSEAVTMGATVRSTADGQLVFTMSRRLSNADGDFAGVVFAAVPLSVFDEATRGAEGGTAAVIALVRDDGAVLALRTRPQPASSAAPTSAGIEGSARNAAPPSAAMTMATAAGVRLPAVATLPAADKSGMIEGRFAADARGQEERAWSAASRDRLFVYTRVGSMPLLLLSGRSTDALNAAWWPRAQWFAGLGLVLSLAIVLLAWRFRGESRHRRLGHFAAVRSESLFRGALDASSTGTALYEVSGKVSYVNPALSRFLGLSAAALLGDKLHAILGAGHWAEDQAAMRQLETRQREHYSTERRFERADGSTAHGWLSISYARGGRSGGLSSSSWCFVVQILDISERVRAEQALNEQNARLLVTLTSIADGVVTTDEEGLVRFVNPAAEAISGWSNEDAMSLPVSTIFSLRDPQSGLPVQDMVRRALAAPRASHISINGVLVNRHGWRRELSCNASAVRRAVDQKAIGAVLVLRDVSESRELHRKLAYNASHDALTGLPNRAAFADFLESALLAVQSGGKQHALAFLDLDRFKIVNDTAGHRAGDTLLKQIALLVPSQLREGDVVGRLGGDELGVILRDCGIDQAKRLMEQIVAAINAMQFVWDGRTYSVGASVGLTAIDARAVSPNAVLTEADVACYAAKNNGRNTVSVYSAEQSEAADWHQKIVLAAGIDEAIAEGRMYLYAQKVEPRDPDEPARWELLSRMFDREGKPIPTSVFIPAAERYDLMGHIDRWNLQHALAELKRALDQGVLIPVHINLSANSLNDEDFVPNALRSIAASGVPPTALTFEITETALMRNLTAATAAINSLRAVGIQIALDDFGIGLSSFGYLRNFPVDVVKIDGGFVANMTQNSVDRNIVKSIHQITRDLGARSVAESVEDAPTLNLLRQLGIDFFQGYGIHRPEPLSKVIDAELARVAARATVRESQPMTGVNS